MILCSYELQIPPLVGCLLVKSGQGIVRFDTFVSLLKIPFLLF
jgi:hypothetical protein